MKGLQLTIASRLRHARTHYGTMQRTLTQREVAQLSGLSPMHVSHLESGTRAPSVDNLVKLAKALGVTTDWLLGL